MKRKFVWLIPSLPVVALLAMLAAITSAAPSGVAGTITLTGGSSGAFYSDQTGFNIVTATVVDSDFSPTRTGVARILIDAAAAGATNPFKLDGTAQTAQGAASQAFLQGEKSITDSFDSTGNGAAMVLSLTKIGRDSNINDATPADVGVPDAALNAEDVILKINGVTKVPSAVTLNATGGIASVTLAAADNPGSAAPAGAKNVTVQYQHSEFDQTAGAATPILSATVQFAADFLPATTKSSVGTNVINNAARTVSTASDLSGVGGTTDSITITFTYNVKETVTEMVSFSSPSLAAKGLTRKVNGTESSAVSNSYAVKAGLFSSSDFDKISTAVNTAGVATIDAVEAAAGITGTPGLAAKIGAAALALDFAATGTANLDQDEAGSDDALLKLLVPVADGEVLTVSYTDDGATNAKTADVDMKAPTIAIVSPVNGAFTNSTTVSVVFKVTDENSAGGKASGLATTDVDTISRSVGGNTADDLVPLLVGTNSFQVSKAFTFVAGTDDGSISFSVPTKDKVGNTPKFADDRTQPQKAQGVANPAVLGAANPAVPATFDVTNNGNPVKITLDTTAPAPLLAASVKTGGVIDTRLTTLPTGAHTGADGAQTLTDALASFVVAGVVVDDKVTNLTDGSSCLVTALTATTLTCGLAGGVENDWDTGDNYKVENPAIGNVKADAKATSAVSFFANTGSPATTATIDPATVDAADFVVVGSTVTSVAVDKAGKSILIGLAAALATDAKPKLELAGSIKDKAGNTMATFTGSAGITSVDGLAPAVTGITLTGDAGTSPRVVSKGTVSIAFSVGESAATTPAVIASYLVIGADNTLAKSGVGAEIDKALTVSSTGVNSWSSSVGIATITGASKSGMVTIQITVTDAAGNVGTAGLADPDGTAVADRGKLKADTYIVEFDSVLNGAFAAGFVVSPDTDATAAFATDIPSPFVTIHFDDAGSAGPGEDNEFYADPDAGGALTALNMDSQKGVTLTSATWTPPGGTATDILSSIVSVDTNSFLFPATGLAVGTHTLSIQAKDAAGNVSISAGSTTPTTHTMTLVVAARATYKVTVNPGFSLVSIPAQPTTTAINDVLGSKTAIKFVMAYDNATGLWLVASRNPVTGTFSGNLTHIDAARGYWVQSDSIATLEFNIPRATGGQPVFPTVVQLFKGWNVVPVGGDPDVLPAGTDIDPDTYFAALDWAAAYTFNTLGVANLKITPASAVACTAQPGAVPVGGQACLEAGTAYLLYMNKDAVLIP
ncbi:MAG: hypothetical protein FJ320_10645 [SAR202 cluster bacterium]|nr:hypothetical protein [SAR202 cluster bacterium]